MVYGAEGKIRKNIYKISIIRKLTKCLSHIMRHPQDVIVDSRGCRFLRFPMCILEEGRLRGTEEKSQVIM